MTPIPSGRALLVPLDQIRASDDFNARKDYREIPALAESIHESGLEQPLVVYRLPRDPTYHLQSGFRRRLALLHLQSKYRKKIEVPVIVKEYKSHEEAMLVALAVDATADPLRNYDLAVRCKLLHEKYSASTIAKITGVQQRNVTMMLDCLAKLDPKVLEFWSKCHVETEPPLFRLQQWTKQPRMIQLKQLDAFRDGDRPPTTDDGELLVGPGGERLDGRKPRPVAVRQELTRLEVRLDDERDAMKRARYEGMQRALKWTLGKVAKLHG